MDREFRIGLFYPSRNGLHFLSPLTLELNLDVLDPASHVSVMGAAERAGLDYVFLADGWGPGGPVSEELGIGDLWLFAPLLAGVLIGASEHIKIITTIHQAFLHPLVIARMGANLDALSGGRWGMNAVSGAGFAPDLIGSTSPTTDHDALYDAAAESMDIALQAWRNQGEVDYHGTYYQAKGRLVGPYPVQHPNPMIVSAGASTAGCEFAGKYASIVFIPGRASPEMIADRRAKIQDAAHRAGRTDTDIKILLHAGVIISDTQAEADALSQRMLDAVSLPAVHEYITRVTKITTYEEIYAQYTEDQLRDLGLTAGTLKMHGDAEHVADQIQELQQRTGCDGLSLSFPIWRPEQIERFGTEVAPILKQRGIWTPAPERNWPW
jgi:FMNH2-dependent dimethyl sulfone monooxygenase